MNAQVKVMGQSSVPAGATNSALVIINNNVSGVETSEKVAELFNSLKPTGVTSLANRWIYQEIVYTSDEKYNALADNITDIAERYFVLALADELYKSFHADFLEKMGIKFAVSESVSLNAAKGAENTLNSAYTIANLLGLVEYGFNNNADLMAKLITPNSEYETLLAEAVKELESNGEFNVKNGYVSVRRKAVLEENEKDVYVIALSESAISTFNLLAEQ